MIEIPIFVITGEDMVNEDVGIKVEPTTTRMLVSSGSICYIIEQVDGCARLAMIDGQDIETPLSYEEVRLLMNEYTKKES